ncbi:MAG: hypothetical protein AB7V08_14995 [Elusimicrobiales bacterium]
MKDAARIRWNFDVKRAVLGWEKFTGIDLVSDNTLLSGGVVPQAVNVDFGLRAGAASKALGTDVVLSGLGNDAISGLHITTIKGKQYLLAACGAKLYAAQGGQQVFTVDTQADWQTGTGTAEITADGKIKAPSGASSAYWESPAYYVGALPYDADLDWFDSVPSGCSVVCKYATSPDGSTWSEWYTHQKGRSLEYIGPYLKVRFELSGSSTSLYVDRFVLRTLGEFGNPRVIYEGLSGYKVRFADYGDKVYFCDGRRPLVWNGTSVRPAGVDPPSTAPTLAAGASGSLSGDYYGKVTFVNEDGVESNPSPASAKVTVTNQKINWTVPTGPAGTAKRRLYRTKAGGLVYYFVAEISDNTTTSYEDNITDDKLVTPMEDDNNVPPDAVILQVHNDVMFYVSAADPRQLWFSKPGRPEQVPNITGKRFYKQFKAPITMVRAPVSGTLVVSGIGYTAVVTGDTFHSDPSVDNTKIRYIGNLGAVSHEAAAACYVERLPVALALVTETLDLYLIYPTYFREDSFAVVPLSRDVEPLFRSIVQRDDVVVAYANQRIYVALSTYDPEYAKGSSGEGNNIVLVYDMTLKQWQGVRTIAAGAILPSPLGVYVGLAGGGFVVRLLRPDEELIWGDRWGEFWGSLPFKDATPLGTDVPVRFVLDTGYRVVKGADKVRARFLRLVVSADSVTDNTVVRVVADGRVQTVRVGSMSSWNVNVGVVDYGAGRQDAVVSPRFPLNLPPARFHGVRIEDESSNQLRVYGVVLECEPVATL